MGCLFDVIAAHAHRQPEALALQGDVQSLSYAGLLERVGQFECGLIRTQCTKFGLLADNSIDWVLADLATLKGNLLMVPLPPFFSPQQLQHAIHNSGLEAILTDQPARVEALLQGQCRRIDAPFAGSLALLQLTVAGEVAAMPAHTAKITYTSGTTGQPKGVCLSRVAMETVAQSLCQASGATAADRHLCLLPLSTLLENIGGIYVPLLAGACACVLPLRKVGLSGAAALEVRTLLHAMYAQRATTAIMVPQMLHALVAALATGVTTPAELRFIAVGGAPVSPRLLAQARHVGLPIFEGYGLSECASVVAVNTPMDNRPGCVGKPLAHVTLKFAEDGEILVGGAIFEGYLGLAEHPDDDGLWATGDIGYLDEQGYLHLTGRKKNMFITSFGRNVAPEWVESELTLQPVIAQAAVYGEARPYNVAIIVPRPMAGVADVPQAVSRAIAAANQTLPDYAQIGKWLIAPEPFTPQNNYLTANGRLRRAEILSAYEQVINQLYEENA